jgi:putative peptidoglycan lipid II flippase
VSPDVQGPRRATKKYFDGAPLARIAGATVTIGALTAVARSTTVAREVVSAGAFGTADVLDAYLIAYAIPVYLLGAVAGSFQSAFVPRYIALRQDQGDGAADRLAGDSLAAMLLGLGAVTLILAAVARLLLPVIAVSFGPAKTELALRLLYVMVPAVFLGAVPIVYSAWLNALERFRVPALLPGVGPLIAVAALIALGPRFGIYALAGGTVAGAAVEVLVVAAAARAAGHRLPLPGLKGTADLAAVAREFWPLLLGTLLFSSTTLVDQIMAASLLPGSIAALGFGSRVTALVIAVAGVGVATSVLPAFSRLVADRDWPTLVRTLVQYGAIVVVLAALISAVVVYFSEPLTGLLFERGNFTSGDTALVARVQGYFALQLPFFLLSLVLVRLLSSLTMSRTVLVITAFNTVLNAVLNYVLMQQMGVAGIALSTTLVHLLSTLLFAAAVATGLKARRSTA